MSEDKLKARERAFEAVYFARVDAELIEKMHKERDAEAARKQLANVTGIGDEELLGRILELGAEARNLQALMLVPLVCVAWANGKLDREERRAALKAAEALGISKESGSYPLFEAWLEKPHGPEFFETWRSYIRTVLTHLDEDARRRLREDLLTRSNEIARASGGILGIGSISKEEQQMITRLEEALA
jgi:hypothetical protein